jgi:hypothetical protein
LFEFDWSRYQRAQVQSIPETIRSFLRAEPAERDRWYQFLEVCILPGASLWEATPHAIPFLQELLGREDVANFIYDMFVHILACTEDPRTGRIGEECRNRIRAGLDTYLRDLANVRIPREERYNILYVIVRLVEDRGRWEPRLRTMCESEPDPELKAEIVDVLSEKTES